MTIDGRNLAAVRDALTVAGTTEADFRNAGVSVANQVDTNQVNIVAPRNIRLSGDVHGNMDFALNAVDRDIVVETTIQSMSVSGLDIESGTVTSLQIMDGTVQNIDIAGGSKRRFQVLDSGGMEIFSIDGLIPNP